MNTRNHGDCTVRTVVMPRTTSRRPGWFGSRTLVDAAPTPKICTHSRIDILERSSPTFHGQFL